MWLRQMAQFSTTISHDQRATAFHCLYISIYVRRPPSCLEGVGKQTFLTSNLGLPEAPEGPLLLALGSFTILASFISTSAILVRERVSEGGRCSRSL